MFMSGIVPGATNFKRQGQVMKNEVDFGTSEKRSAVYYKIFKKGPSKKICYV